MDPNGHTKSWTNYYLQAIGANSIIFSNNQVEDATRYDTSMLFSNLHDTEKHTQKCSYNILKIIPRHADENAIIVYYTLQHGMKYVSNAMKTNMLKLSYVQEGGEEGVRNEDITFYETRTLDMTLTRRQQ